MVPSTSVSLLMSSRKEKNKTPMVRTGVPEIGGQPTKRPKLRGSAPWVPEAHCPGSTPATSLRMGSHGESGSPVGSLTLKWAMVMSPFLVTGKSRQVFSLEKWPIQAMLAFPKHTF